ncbi:energy transducer TonB [Pukyongia salina]|uniref:Energy transducer TonB n=1 Tax=Pukyongia salina TaxID=2094025 RepID=A0A2S0HUD3_9FLAO|nr:energy transducer TonB [Pukyongia salina]AVI50287.1 energy transducer TonB [Pukyongia salina]
MEVKKNPKFDLGKRSMIFFQIGMIFMLFLTWQALEIKSYDTGETERDLVDVSDALEEIIPVTEPLNTPPPPPPAQTVTAVIIQVEDEADIEETIIESTETDENAEIVEIEEIDEVIIEEEIINVPFHVIENVPIYPGCENLSNNNDRKRCMSEKVQQFVQNKFNTELAGELGLEGRQRIHVQFRIDNKGKVVDVRARAPHPRLEQEAIKVVSSLPDMQPGKQSGKPVGVQYALPILFEVRTD